ncbi:MAG TPA: MarR family transcriptional regulator [Mycobacteriales bacterium]|nr:MarR family transcriptional regulator [Mycobacteriales bacterium]
MAEAVDLELATRLRIGIMRLARRLRHEGSQGDITPSQLAALGTIDKRGPLTLGELAQLERVQPPSMTKIVGNLCDAGLVSRSPDPSDGRITLVAATKAGRAHLVATRKRRDAWLEEHLHSLAPEEREALARAADVIERLADS